jgi:hypothetical protein
MKKPNLIRLVAAFALATGAGAAATITLDEAPTVFYQQTEASPCVIGGENCQNEVFPWTVEGSGGSGTESDTESPVYSLASIQNVVGGNLFSVGLDYNDSSKPQILREFSLVFCADESCAGEVGTPQTYTGPTDLKTIHNGVGFSDFLLEGFDLGDDNDSAEFVKFVAQWLNNAGPDRYFVISGDDPGTDVPPIPESSTLLMMGGGLLALVRLRRKWH